MRSRNDSNRWWENYLVRYLVPSIAGMFAVKWLDENSASTISVYLRFLNFDNSSLSTGQLIAWFLFGNLFCYVASYPILVFHATRVLDFKSVKGDLESYSNNPYALSILLLGLAAFFVAIFSQCHLFAALVLSILYSSYQIYRIKRAYFSFGKFGFHEKYEASPEYAFLSKLSVRRSISETTTVRNADENEEVTSEREKDLSDSYRHLREHGNSAFIFVLEIILCVLSYLVLTDEGVISSQLGSIGRLTLVWVIWSAPAVLVHLAGQHLERRFSLWTHEIK